MNRQLLDPFELEYPEEIEACLDDEYATHCRFNRAGNYLATARSDGTCWIWDFETLSTIAKLRHGDRAITHVSWSKNSRYLLTAGEDGVCIIWDLKTKAPKSTVTFPHPIIDAHISPVDPTVFIACPAKLSPSIVYSAATSESADVQHIVLGASTDSGASKQQASCCAFDRTGTFCYFGTTKGYLFTIDVATRQTLCSTRLCMSALKSISTNRHMKELVVNANDRVIRVVSVTEEGAVGDSGRDEPRQTVELTVTTRIQDHVNRVQWSQACFSSSGELVISGSHHKAEHHIYIWDKFTGTLVKMLTGPHELLEDFSVHPLRPIIASISTFGMIYLWTRKPQQNWNAFAPGFEELEENIDYVEPEDEFDRNPEPKPKPTDAKGSGDGGDNEDFEIDIMTTEPMFSDSDSDDPDRDFYIPIVPEEAELSPPAAAQGTNNYDGEPILLVAVEDVGSRTSNVATITPTVAAVSDPSDFTTGRLNGVHSPQSSPYPHHRDT